MDIWAMQNSLIAAEKAANKNYVKQLAQEGLNALDTDSAALHENATRNGEPQPLYAVRKKNKECKITVKVGDEIFCGDYIEVFDETWLVISTYKDECDITRATAYLCNHLFKFPNESSDIVERWGIVDDGNYASRMERELPLAEGSYKAYIPLDSETEKIFIDKRFALDKMYDQKLNQILSVVDVVWIDKQSGNLSEGDHLLKLRLQKGQYDPQVDDIERMVCDYKFKDEPQEPIEPDEPTTPPTSNLRCVIEGASTIRLGNARNYTVKVLNEDGEVVDTSADTFVWEYEQVTGITFVPNNDVLSVQVSMSSALMGQIITIKAVDLAENYIKSTFDIEIL